MRMMQLCLGVVVSLLVPNIVWAQAASTPIVDPPRQQMQVVVPNLRVGPYLLNITGKTYVSDTFLDVEVTDSGRPVPDGTDVTLSAVPATTGNSIPDGGSPLDLTAATTAGHAKFAPDLAADGDWMLSFGVAGPSGNAISPPQKVGIDPHRPPAPLLFSIASVATPIVAVVVLLALFRMRHVELERWPAAARDRPAHHARYRRRGRRPPSAVSSNS